MLKKIILMMFMFVFLIFSVSATTVYQETADSWGYNNTWSGHSINTPDKAVDENYSTYASGFTTNGDSIFFNYTIPVGAEQATTLWQTKDGLFKQNLTVPLSCWNAFGTIISLKASLYFPLPFGGTTTWDCFNGSTWQNIYSNSGSGVLRIFEEAMFWDVVVTDSTPPATITGLTSPSQSATNILWSWTNPLDGDFDSTIVYLDGDNIVNTSNNYYSATDLACGATHIIDVNTKDATGNVNATNVSLTTSSNTCPSVGGSMNHQDETPKVVTQTITTSVVESKSEGFFSRLWDWIKSLFD
jgi:hypothetical protein